jgi:hypothetical protein
VPFVGALSVRQRIFDATPGLNMAKFTIFTGDEKIFSYICPLVL